MLSWDYHIYNKFFGELGLSHGKICANEGLEFSGRSTAQTIMPYEGTTNHEPSIPSLTKGGEEGFDKIFTR